MRQLIPFVLSILIFAVTWPPRVSCADDVILLGDITKKYKIREVQPWPELKPSSGSAFRADSAVVVLIGPKSLGGKLVLPRLNNPTKRVFLIGRQPHELKFVPEVKEWIITLPKELPEGAKPAVVVETIGRPHLPLEPERIRPDDDGLFILPAHKAVTHGEKLRYEPQPHKNTVGYWTNPKDFANWVIEVPKAGEYDVYVLQGCGKGQGGSDVSIHVRSLGAEPQTAASVAFVVKETGHFQNFVRRKVGSVSIDGAGRHTVEIRPDRLANKAVMDVREVRLVPK
jgi:hypothetical protein